MGICKKIRLADKLKALKLLGRYKKMWTDKVEHGGKITLESLITGEVND